MHCLILGGCGFIGSHLCETLLSQGHNVRVFDRSSADRQNTRAIAQAIDLHQGDLGNTQAVSAALAGIDTVYHLICSTHPSTSNQDPGFDLAANVLPTLSMLDACLKHGVQRVVFLSSGGTVYGIPKQTPISESHPTAPICAYGVHKVAIEKYLHLYHHLHGLKVSILRVANPYGARQRPDHAQGAVRVFAHRMLNQLPLTVWGDGSVVRDYLHVDDVAQAAAMCLQDANPIATYNIGSGQGHSLKQLIDQLTALTGLEPNVQWQPARKLDVPINVLDPTLAKTQLGWTPTHSFESGLEKMVTHLQANN